MVSYMIMKRAYAAGVLLLIAGFLLVAAVPNRVSAETILNSGTEIFEDTVWTKEGSPYLVRGMLGIAETATLSIEPGVEVQFSTSAGIEVLGRLFARGSPEEPIVFTSLSESEWKGISFENKEASSALDYAIVRYARSISDLYSKDLLISNTRVEYGRDGIDVSGSRLSLTNFSVENMYGEGIDISNGSDVTLKNIVLKNVDSGMVVYLGSEADISNLVIDTVWDSGGIDVFLNSKVTLRDSSIANIYDNDAIGVFASSSVTVRNTKITYGAYGGVAVYGGGSVDIQDSTISGFTDGSGLADYGRHPNQNPNSLFAKRNEIRGNAVGVSLYPDAASAYVLSDNSIYGNSELGLEISGAAAVDVSNNFWGDPSGPFHDTDNPDGKGDGIYVSSKSSVLFSPWLTSDPLAPDPCASGSCVSNVLFLPGIEASRLYEGLGCGATAEEKLWEPIGESLVRILRGAGDDKVERLFLDAAGASICPDIYTKSGDVIGAVRNSRIYQSFIDEMDGLEADGTLNDWEPAAYDWRLSLGDLLDKGAERGGNIYYSEATSTPYIEQTLRALAASSKTGRVSIVAHSNGGLVAKALLDRLGAAATELVDKVIVVGAPQSGAPVDIGALLYGYNQDISSYGVSILHSSVARTLAGNSPMAYHLLPSEDYLESTMGDAAHPVIRFSGAGYAKEAAAYGATIANRVALDDFLLAKEGGREKPEPDDIHSAEILNPVLIDYANGVHATLDAWAPPEGIEIVQIAGWGVDTVAGIDFYTLPAVGALAALEPVRAYRPIFTEDGDGTVPVPSALMMASSTDVRRYWVDLFAYNNETHSNRSHKDLFEIPSLNEFVKNIIKNSADTLPAYISTSQPPPETEKKTLTFFLHSPLTLELADASGNITGLTEDDSVVQGIPGSTYGEFGEVKYVSVPGGGQYELTLRGQASGTFSLDMQESSGGVVTLSSTIANVPTTEGTLASLTISGGIETASPLSVDTDGDGVAEISLAPSPGETVSYEPPEPEPLPEPEPEPARVSSTRGGRRVGAHSGVPAAPAVITPATPLEATPIKIAREEKAVPVAPKAQESSRAAVIPKESKGKSLNALQTASAYEASQQPAIKKLGRAFYTKLYGFWAALKKLF